MTATTALILFAHGSRDPAWRQPMEHIARIIHARASHVPVACAYLELDQPDLPHACHQLLTSHPTLTHVHVMPLFLGMGRHAREDLPNLMLHLRHAHPQVEFKVLPSVGESHEVLELVARLALQSTEA